MVRSRDVVDLNVQRRVVSGRRLIRVNPESSKVACDVNVAFDSPLPGCKQSCPELRTLMWGTVYSAASPAAGGGDDFHSTTHSTKHVRWREWLCARHTAPLQQNTQSQTSDLTKDQIWAV